jgi:hypothetical protein
MRSVFPLAAVAAGLVLLAAAPAVLAADQTLKIEFSNLPSFDEKGSADNTSLVYTLAPQAYITGLRWSVNLSALDPSWLSELTLDLTSSSGEGVQLSPGDGSNVAGTLQASGQLDLVNSGLGFRLQDDGRLVLEFYDAVNDLPGADGRWASGQLQLTYTAPVPEPASAGLLMAGLLAVGAWRARGRPAASRRA